MRYINSKNILFFLVSAMAALVLAACFTGYTGGSGTLVISVGGHGNSRAMLDIDAELASIEHEIILRGPGGTITKTFKGAATATIELSAGSWDVTVRAVGNTPIEYNQEPFAPASDNDGTFPPRMLRALGWDTVDIKAGQSSNAKISMAGATEVSNADQLRRALERADEAGEELILVSGNITVPYIPGFAGFYVDPGISVTLMADEDAAITQDPSYIGTLIKVNGGTLRLGRPGMRGQLAIDGGGSSSIMVEVLSDGQLIMNDGVTLRNGGCGVRVSGDYVSGTDYPGTFIMNGGYITGNIAYEGGGVYVDSYGIFNMFGGSIVGNTADYGGGVYHYDGEVVMTGGTISGNYAIQSVLNSGGNGGGVYTKGSMYGFTASESALISGNNAANDGGGVYIDQGNFTLTDSASITGNTAGRNGGGLCGTNGYFYMDGGKITGNTAGDRGGGVYYNYAGNYGSVDGGEISGNLAHGLTNPNNPGGGVWGMNFPNELTQEDIDSIVHGNTPDDCANIPP